MIVALLFLGAVGFWLIRSTAIAQGQEKSIGWARIIEAGELGLFDPTGLTYSPADNALLVAMADGQLAKVDLLSERAEGLTFSQPVLDPLNLAFVPQTASLYLYQLADQRLVEVPQNPDRAGQSGVGADLRPLALGQVRGLAVDPLTGRLFILDSGRSRIVALSPDNNGRYGGRIGPESGRVQIIELASWAGKELRGIAYDPARGHLFVLSPAEDLLVELDESGETVASYDLLSMPLIDPQGMVFAPSGDSTDEPDTTSLYVADQTATGGQIVELFFEQPAAPVEPAASLPSSLANVIDTAAWSPPSPDPSGVDYWPATGGLLVSDSEVEEMTIYQGANIYQSTLSGGLLATCTTFPEFSKEPTGLSVSPDNGHIFISDDSARRIFEINLGPDGLYCTADDLRSFIDTRAFGSTDPEDVAYGAGSLFVSDGLDREVYRVTPGLNGVFDGLPPDGDDEVTSFDTNSLGLKDPEGIDYNPDNNTLFIVSRSESFVLEATLDGVAVNTIDFSFANIIAPAGVGYGPRSADPNAKSLYISDRAIDNNQDPDENDGKIYEIAFSYGPTPTSTPTATATNTPTATATNTPTGTATSTPTATATSTPMATATNTPTATATNTPTATATSTPTATATNTPTATATNTPTATATNTPTATATNTPTATATNTPTGSDTSLPPTNTPSPTATNTLVPTPIQCCQTYLPIAAADSNQPAGPAAVSPSESSIWHLAWNTLSGLFD